MPLRVITRGRVPSHVSAFFLLPSLELPRARNPSASSLSPACALAQSPFYIPLKYPLRTSFTPIHSSWPLYPRIAFSGMYFDHTIPAFTNHILHRSKQLFQPASHSVPSTKLSTIQGNVATSSQKEDSHSHKEESGGGSSPRSEGAYYSADEPLFAVSLTSLS